MSLLLESIKYENGHFFNLEAHEGRMQQSVLDLLDLKMSFDLRQLITIPNQLSKATYKCRILYDQAIKKVEFILYQKRTLKEIVFNRASGSGHLFAGLIDRVKLFCTVYDPTSGRYRFDNSLFFQIGVGATAILAIIFYLFNEILRSRRARKQE